MQFFNFRSSQVFLKRPLDIISHNDDHLYIIQEFPDVNGLNLISCVFMECRYVTQKNILETGQLHAMSNTCQRIDYTCSWCKAKTLTRLPLEKYGRHFADDIFICIFMNETFCILVKISQKFVPNGPIDNKPAMTPNKWQAIIWTNAGSIHWRIYAALNLTVTCTFRMITGSISIISIALQPLINLRVK